MTRAIHYTRQDRHEKTGLVVQPRLPETLLLSKPLSESTPFDGTSCGQNEMTCNFATAIRKVLRLCPRAHEHTDVRTISKLATRQALGCLYISQYGQNCCHHTASDRQQPATVCFAQHLLKYAWDSACDAVSLCLGSTCSSCCRRSFSSCKSELSATSCSRSCRPHGTCAPFLQSSAWMQTHTGLSADSHSSRVRNTFP